ncbi:MAG: aldehyde dehydrogenase family protein [Deltaproteobacteria bacterium]|nr:MAG: aldehyde dehydrogenase family protein [Deltaproteobacteria bacterium]
MSADPRPGSVNPATGAPLDDVTWNAAADVAAVVERARAAQKGWAATPLAERARRVLDLGRRIAERRHEVVAILDDEMGRASADSLISEVATIVDYTKGVVSVGKAALAPEKVALSPITFPGKKAVIEQVPRGVIGIIEPWNYPLLQFHKSLFPALLAGNGVVLKPSEHTPRTAQWLHKQCEDLFPAGLVGIVIGGGEVGSALVEADIDGLVFTGSVRTGKKVAARAAERLIPFSVELGGKDAAIVLADCALERTVQGLVWASMHNAGQDCSAVERIYVEQAIADAFVDKFTAAVERLRTTPNEEVDVGPLQNAAQLRIVEAHVADAIAKGATVRCGGKATGAGYGFQPTVLDHCDMGMDVVVEETFGPVAAIIRVKDADEAIDRANASRFGLGGSVWTQDLAKGERLARQLEVGLAHVNTHKFAGVVPSIPWTGTKETGTGIAASRHAYHTFVRPRTIIVDKGKDPEPFWLPISGELLDMGHTLAEFQLGSFLRVFTLLGLLKKRVNRVRGK